MSEFSDGLRRLAPKGYSKWARGNIGDYDDRISAHKRIDKDCDKLLEILKKMKADAEESDRKCKEISDKFDRTCFILITVAAICLIILFCIGR